jgi:hypothetical protein
MTCLISGIAQSEIETALNNYNFGIKTFRTFEESLFDIYGNIKHYGRKIGNLLNNVEILKISNKMFLYKTNDNKFIQIDISLNYDYVYKFKIRVYKK